MQVLKVDIEKSRFLRLVKFVFKKNLYTLKAFMGKISTKIQDIVSWDGNAGDSSES